MASALTRAGSLLRDREYALFDDAGQLVTAKNEPAVHRLRVTYDRELTEAVFSRSTGDDRFAFSLRTDDRSGLEAWFGTFLGRPVSLRRAENGGFPDDVDATGPTIVSLSTLHEVASWFPGLDASSIRGRLRANIELAGVPAFWEDQIVAATGETVPFRIGDARFEGVNPCARCVVPSRDPESGVPILDFAKRVSERRAATLPAWADRSRFTLHDAIFPVAGHGVPIARPSSPFDRLHARLGSAGFANAIRRARVGLVR